MHSSHTILCYLLLNVLVDALRQDAEKSARAAWMELYDFTDHSHGISIRSQDDPGWVQVALLPFCSEACMQPAMIHHDSP